MAWHAPGRSAVPARGLPDTLSQPLDLEYSNIHAPGWWKPVRLGFLHRPDDGTSARPRTTVVQPPETPTYQLHPMFGTRVVRNGMFSSSDPRATLHARFSPIHTPPAEVTQAGAAAFARHQQLDTTRTFTLNTSRPNLMGETTKRTHSFASFHERVRQADTPHERAFVYASGAR